MATLNKELVDLKDQLNHTIAESNTSISNLSQILQQKEVSLQSQRESALDFQKRMSAKCSQLERAQYLWYLILESFLNFFTSFFFSVDISSTFDSFFFSY